MDFRSLGNLKFEEASLKDYRDFRSIMCYILERDKVFPAKFETFDDPQGDWEKLFSAWHIVNSYQYIYREKKEPYQNMAVLLSKLEETIYPDDEQVGQENNNSLSAEQLSDYMRVALRLLILSCLTKIKNQNPKTTQ